MAPASRAGGRRLAIALALTIGPILVLAFLGYHIVEEREHNLRLTYTATGGLVRDRLATAVALLESTLTKDAVGLGDLDHAEAIQTRLRELATALPWIDDLFVVRPPASLVSAEACLSCPGSFPKSNTAATSPVIREAETAEFQRSELAAALQLYRQALNQAHEPAGRSLARARIGRTLFKLNRIEEGIATYRQLESEAGNSVDAHGVPYVVVARAEIADMLATAGKAGEAAGASLELASWIAGHPWNVDAGYGYYVRRALAAAHTDKDLHSRLTRCLSAVETIEWLQAELLPRVGDVFANPGAGGGVQHVSLKRQESTTTIGLLQVQSASAAGSASLLGFTVRTDHIGSVLLAEALKDVTLTGNVLVDLAPPDSTSGVTPLVTASLDGVLTGWNVAIVDTQGRSLEQLSARERWAYGTVVGGVLLVLVIGVAFTTRAWAREAELSRVRADFVSSVSHELKTPLALIRMFGETLESGLVDDEAKRQEFYGIIRRESERLTHLINNVLDTARIEAGTKQFTFQSGDIVALVREALDAYGPLFARLNFTVNATLPSSPLPVNLDRDAVARALVNLFQNAIRYSDQSKRVDVSIEQREREVVVLVADQGIGISSSEQSRIFDKFYRSDTKNGEAVSGSGLGLSIVRHIMLAHGGRVEVTSALGEGSEFALVFPSVRSAA
jgi:signal transduction histidine kinase